MELIGAARSGVEWRRVVWSDSLLLHGALRAPAAVACGSLAEFNQRPMRWDVPGLFGCSGGSLLPKALGAALRSACGRARAKLFGVVLNGPERS